MNATPRRRPRPLPLRPAAALACLLFLGAAPALALPALDELAHARGAFEYGDFERAAQVLDRLDTTQLPLEADRVEVYRLLGLAEYYLFKRAGGLARHREAAQEAFFGLLKQNPDFALDPFYVPPDAVAFFEQVRQENEPYLAPIRERRQARIKEQRREEEARAEAERLRRQMLAERAQVPVVVERQLARNSPLVAWMPFGLGQLQNGHNAAGYGLAAGQVVSGAASLLAYGLISAMRGDDGRFPPDRYKTAQTLDQVKWWGAGVFYGLWLAGAVQANIAFVPQRVLSEVRTVPPSAAPDGPLAPPVPAAEPDPAPPPADGDDDNPEN